MTRRSLLFALGALVMWSAEPLASAPVPPPPRLSSELLAGATWQFEWGPFEGVIALNTDGTYILALEPPDGPCYLGTWYVTQGRLVLSHRLYDPARGTLDEHTAHYEIALACGAYPTLVGRWNNERVVLSDPQR